MITFILTSIVEILMLLVFTDRMGHAHLRGAKGATATWGALTVLMYAVLFSRFVM